MTSERGSVTIWTLGLSILLLVFGGLSVDFWRALALQRELAAVADSAAVASASGIDEAHYRLTGEILIDPERATRLGTDYLASQDVELVGQAVTASSDGTAVSVVVEAILDLGLIGVFVEQSEPLRIRAAAVARPVLVP